MIPFGGRWIGSSAGRTLISGRLGGNLNTEDGSHRVMRRSLPVARKRCRLGCIDEAFAFSLDVADDGRACPYFVRGNVQMVLDSVPVQGVCPCVGDHSTEQIGALRIGHLIKRFGPSSVSTRN